MTNQEAGEAARQAMELYEGSVQPLSVIQRDAQSAAEGFGRARTEFAAAVDTLGNTTEKEIVGVARGEVTALEMGIGSVLSTLLPIGDRCNAWGEQIGEAIASVTGLRSQLDVCDALLRTDTVDDATRHSEAAQAMRQEAAQLARVALTAAGTVVEDTTSACRVIGQDPDLTDYFPGAATIVTAAEGTRDALIATQTAEHEGVFTLLGEYLAEHRTAVTKASEITPKVRDRADELIASLKVLQAKAKELGSAMLHTELMAAGVVTSSKDLNAALLGVCGGLEGIRLGLTYDQSPDEIKAYCDEIGAASIELARGLGLDVDTTPSDSQEPIARRLDSAPTLNNRGFKGAVAAVGFARVTQENIGYVQDGLRQFMTTQG